MQGLAHSLSVVRPSHAPLFLLESRALHPSRPIARRYLVSGCVQGVGFRFFAMGAAARAGVSGFARNLRDGRVEVYALGDPGQLDALRRELETGPRFAAVHSVEQQDAPTDSRYAGDFRVESDV